MNRTPTQTTRRRLIQTAGGAAAGLALAPLGARVAQAAPQSQDAAKGGTVTYAYLQKPVSLDATIWSGDSDNQVSRQIFDSLVYSPEAGKFEPWLATSWEMSPS